jgi:hypothetical protein
MASYNKALHRLSFRPVLGTSNLTCLRFVSCLLGSILVATLFSAPIASASSSLDMPDLSARDILLAQRALEDSTSERATNPTVLRQDSLNVAPTKEHKEKSQGKAFLYNLGIPGTGHLYAGYKRGFAYLGVEGLSWATYFYYHGLGKDKEDQFQGYADNHWDYNKWIAACNCQGSAEDQLIRNFYNTNKQQYYEDIGKIPTYFQGWDDYNANNNDSANRRFYRGMRTDSNNFLKNASYALMVAFVNRIVSAVDVVRLMKKEKETVNIGPSTSLQFKMHTKPFNRENAFGFQITKQL